MKIDYLKNKVYNLTKVNNFINKNKTNVYYTYDLKTGKSVYELSLELYGTEDYATLLMLINNCANINDWYLNARDFKIYLANEYKDDLLKTKYMVNARTGFILDDTINNTDASEFQAVSNYDYELTKNFNKKYVSVIDSNFISKITEEMIK